MLSAWSRNHTSADGFFLIWKMAITKIRTQVNQTAVGRLPLNSVDISFNGKVIH
jgi:hypothetical protein